MVFGTPYQLHVRVYYNELGQLVKNGTAGRLRFENILRVNIRTRFKIKIIIHKPMHTFIFLFYFLLHLIKPPNRQN